MSFNHTKTSTTIWFIFNIFPIIISLSSFNNYNFLIYINYKVFYILSIKFPEVDDFLLRENNYYIKSCQCKANKIIGDRRKKGPPNGGEKAVTRAPKNQWYRTQCWSYGHEESELIQIEGMKLLRNRADKQG